MKRIFVLLLIGLLDLPLSIGSDVIDSNCNLIEISELNDHFKIISANCLSERNLEEEYFAQSSSPAEVGPVCGKCKDNLNSLFPVTNEDKKRLRKQAYFDGMYLEYKKAMSALTVDMVSTRTLFSTGSDYLNSSKSCSATVFQEKINKSCTKDQKAFFERTNFSSEIAGEIAALLSTNTDKSSGILDRSNSTNSCNISDQSILRLKPRLLEESITPEFVNKIANSKATTVDQIHILMNTDDVDAVLYQLLLQHPILRSMAEDPKAFISFFSLLKNEKNPKSLREALKKNLYTPKNGDILDAQTASRCEKASSSFVSSICNKNFDDSSISFGDFENFKKINNNERLPTDDKIGSEMLLNKNFRLMEFCDQRKESALNFSKDANLISGFMIGNDIQSSLSSYAIRKFNDDIDAPKNRTCHFDKLQGCNDNSLDCSLYHLYKESKTKGSTEYNLANNPDKSINNILKAIVGNPRNITPTSRKVLEAEGILPQANGKFVERPDVPERKPEYLADVANGTITPNTESSASSAAPIPNSNRAQKTQNQSQLASLQPLQGGNSTAAPEKVAENTAEDDSEDLRRFQEGLKERLDRAEGDAAEGNKNSKVGKAKRVPASKLESPEGIVNPSALAAIAAPAPTADTSSEQTLNAPAAAPVGGKASLGPETGRQALANKQKNSALGDMSGAKSNPFAKASAGSDPLSGDGIVNSAESTVALTLSGDIQTSLKQILESKDTQGANLRSLIEKGRPFKFELNNSVFNVQFENETVNVVFRSGDPSVGPKLAATLQSVFNTTVKRSSDQTAISQRNAKLGDLKNAVGN